MAESVNLGTVFAKFRLDMTGVGEGINKAKGELNAFAAAVQKSAHEPINQLAQSMGTKMAAAGAGMAGGLGMAVKAAASFDQSMRNVNSLAKIGESQFQALSKSVLALADDPKIVQGPTDLAKGLYDVYSSGFQGKEALDILRQSAYGASAGMTDTATASRVLMAVMNSGVKGVNNAQEAMDVLFREVDLGVNTFPELANALGDVLPTAKTAGVSLQEVSAALAVMTRRGINVNESVTALNQLLNHIIKPGKEAREMMDKLGIQYGVAALQSKGLTGVLQDIIAKTHGNKQALTALVPEIRGMKALLTLTDEGGRQYTEMLNGMSTATTGAGATQRALAEQLKGPEMQFQELKKSTEAMAISIGNVLLPQLNRLMGRVKDVTDAFSRLSPATRDNVVNLVAVGSGALIMAGILTKVITTISVLAAAWRSVKVAAQGAAAAEAAASVAGAGGGAKGLAGKFAGVGGVLVAGAAAAGLVAHNELVSEAKWQQGVKDYAAMKKKKAADDANYPHIKALYDKAKAGSASPSQLKELQNAGYQLPASGANPMSWANPAVLKELNLIRARKGLPAMSPGQAVKVAGGHITVNPHPGASTSKLPGDDDDDDDGSKETRAQRKAKRLAQEKARKAAEHRQRLAEMQQQTADDLYRATHSQYDEERRDADQEYTRALKAGVSKKLAMELKKARYDKIADEEKKANYRLAEEMGKGLEESGFGVGSLVGTVEALADQQRVIREMTAGLADDAKSMSADIEASLAAAKEAVRRSAVEDMSAGLSESLKGQVSSTILDPSALKTQIEEQRKQEEQQMRDRFQFMPEFARNMGSEFYDEFTGSLDKAFGKNPVGRAFARTMSSWFDKLMSNTLDQLFNGGGSGAWDESIPGQPKQKLKIGGLLGGTIGSIFGGGLGGSIGGALGGMLGFDDPVNDRSARRWGFDFGSLFQQGTAASLAQRGAGLSLAAAGNGQAQAVTINVHMPNAQIASSVDMTRLYEGIGREVATQLNTRVGK
jgi:TP901 family phage tail tape measure protein